MSHHRSRAHHRHHVSSPPAAPSPTQDSKPSAFAKLRPLILVVILVVLLAVLFAFWNVFQAQQQAQYAITGDDLQQTTVLDRFFRRSPTTPTTQPQEGLSELITENPPQAVGGRLGPNQIAQGEQVYSISTSGTGPAINRLVVDEFDPPTGSQQGILVETQYNQPIDSVTATIQTDSNTQTHQLNVVEGDNLKGVWGGQWPVTDSHDVIYSLTLTATSQGRPTSTITLSFR